MAPALPRFFASVLLLSLGFLPGCAGLSFDGSGSASASSVPDPREENPWFAAGRRAVGRTADRIEGTQRARNVILFVGDGMGITTITAARILEGQRKGQTGEENSLAIASSTPYLHPPARERSVAGTRAA